MPQIKLDIGCGKKIRNGYDGVDKIDFGQRYVLDVRFGLPFEDETVDAIAVDNFLEHLNNAEAIKFLNECWRVIKPKAELFIVVPHVFHSGGGFLLQHNSYWTERSFDDLKWADRWTVYGIRCWSTTYLVISKDEINVKLIKSGGIPV